MVEEKQKLKIDYSKLDINNPASFINYGAELYQEISKDKKISFIKYTKGFFMDSTPRIITDKGTINIEFPKSENEKFKLSALLYTIANCKRIRAEIVYDDYKGRSITTTHKQHKGKFQSELEKMVSGIEIKELEVKKVNKYFIKGVEVGKEQYNEFNNLPKSQQEIWYELSKYADSNGIISEENLFRFLKQTGKDIEEEKEKIFYLNNEIFFQKDLDFDIDFGKKPYSEFIKMKERIKELEKSRD